MRLIPPKSIVTFAREPINDDQKLERILAEFVSELAAEKPGKEIVLRALVEQVLVHPEKLLHAETLRRARTLSRRPGRPAHSSLGRVDAHAARSGSHSESTRCGVLSFTISLRTTLQKTHRRIAAQLSRRHSRHARAVVTRRNRSFRDRSWRACRLSKWQPLHKSISYRNGHNAAGISQRTRLAKQRRRNASPIMRKICRFKTRLAAIIIPENFSGEQVNASCETS